MRSSSCFRLSALHRKGERDARAYDDGCTQTQEGKT